MFILAKVDAFLNAITMYRLLHMVLRVLAAAAIIFGFLGWLPYSGWAQLVSLVTLIYACFLTNFFFAKLFKAPTNYESPYITGLILFFLLSPTTDIKQLGVMVAVGVVAMASKFFLAIKKKHLFNPAAFSVMIFGLFGITNAIWWGGAAQLLPFTAILGLLLVRKIRRFQLFVAFLVAAIVTISIASIQQGMAMQAAILNVLVGWPVVFFGTIMLVEPLTSPTRKTMQVVYGVLVGILLGLQFRIGPIFSSPELALVLGNLFAYLVSAKDKLFLSIQEIKQLSPNIYEIIFSKNTSFSFLPGQYFEWTLEQKKRDTRGNRRYFTIASSPTEPDLRLGIRYANPPSSFKDTLIHASKNTQLVASQLGGDFVLPKEQSKKLVFIAGGIGITPFRSMIKYLVDTKEKRDIVLFYSNSDATDIVYKELIATAAKEIGLRVQYVLTDKEKIPQGWTGLTGRLSSDMLAKEVPDYQERIFYLSGPNVMVNGYKQLLRGLSVSSKQIKTDYFPGY